MFAVHKEKNFKLPNQMVIAKFEFHTAVLLRINFYLLLDTVFCVCVCVCVSQSFKKGNACLGKVEAFLSLGVRVP